MRINPDYFKYSFQNLIHRKLRSWLTIISILIGIMAIYSLVSFGQGLSSYVNDLSAEMGTDKLIIQTKGIGAPGTDENFALSKEDLDFTKKIKGVGESTGLYFKTVEIESRNIKKYAFLVGQSVDTKEAKLVEEFYTVSVTKGRALTKGDKFKAVLGHNYQIPDKIFSKPLKVGDKVTLNGIKVKIIGFFEEVGNPQDDTNIYMTIDGFESIYPDSKDKYSIIVMRSAPNVDPTPLADKVEDKLRKFKDQEEGKENFYVQTFEQALETFTNIIGVINGVLALIALISLLVAGVNIMNTMYTAVIERTQEIGIMKAIGARNSDIASIFLFESGLLGMIGGALGIVVGYGVSKLGGAIAANAGYAMLRPEFPLALTIGCLLFAFLVGALAGLFPAKQAAKLKPVDALRYE